MDLQKVFHTRAGGMTGKRLWTFSLSFDLINDRYLHIFTSLRTREYESIGN